MNTLLSKLWLIWQFCRVKAYIYLLNRYTWIVADWKTHQQLKTAFFHGRVPLLALKETPSSHLNTKQARNSSDTPPLIPVRLWCIYLLFCHGREKVAELCKAMCKWMLLWSPPCVSVWSCRHPDSISPLAPGCQVPEVEESILPFVRTALDRLLHKCTFLGPSFKGLCNNSGRVSFLNSGIHRPPFQALMSSL